MNSINDLPTNVAIFLGAGASAFAGYRTFASFPDLIFSEDIRNQEELGELHSEVQRFLKEVEQSLQIEGKATTHDNFLWALNDYTNLWHVLRVNDVLRSRFLKSTFQWGEFAYFSQIVENAINDLTTTTIRHYSKNKVEAGKQSSYHHFGNFKNLFGLYLSLASRNNDQTPYLPVFTTNYDLLIEDLFSEFSNTLNPALQLINGVPGCINEGSVWNCEEYIMNPKGLHFYRLHGCVSWYCDSSTNELIYFHRGSDIQHSIANLCAVYPGNDLSIGLNPHAYSFRRLNEVLKSCSVVLFIGFSFRDYDVIHVLLSANAQRASSLKLVVVDPTLTAITVINRLTIASSRTQFPIRLPAISDVKCINIRFGANNFAQVIYDVVNKTLNEEGKIHD